MKHPPKLGDLFAPILQRAEFHPYFARVLDHGAPAEKAVVNAWAKGFADRDGKFVKEFQGSFNSSFWELYLHAALRTLGFGIDCTHDRPDFLISGECGDLALEAVVALNPDEHSPDWAKHASPRGLDFERLLDLASVRLAQSVQSKSDKWLKSYSALSHCRDRGFIVCVAPFEQPFGQLQGTQAIARVLFGEVHDLFLQDGERLHRVGENVQTETFKPSGAPIRLGLFRDPSLAHVSGVIFSSLATWSKVSALADDDGQKFEFHAVRRVGNEIHTETSSKADYRETLLDGLHLFLNPFASRPLSALPWRRAGVGVHQLLGPELRADSDVPNGTLVMRRCVRFVEPGTAAYAAGTPNASDYVTHELAKPRDGEWFGGPGVLGMSDSVFLMLHDGWTICVSRDRYDDDWQYIVKWGEFRSLQAFIDAGDPGPSKAGIDASLESRDAALSSARELIASKLLRKWRSSSKKKKR